MVSKKSSLLVILLIWLIACNSDDPATQELRVLQVLIGQTQLDLTGQVTSDIPVDRSISIVFSAPLNTTSATHAISIQTAGQPIDAEINFSTQDKTVVIFPTGALISNTTYSIVISDQLQGAKGEPFLATTISFKTVRSALTVTSLKIGTDEDELNNTELIINKPLTPTINITFSYAVDPALINSSTITLKQNGTTPVALEFAIANDGKTVTLVNTTPMHGLTRYYLALNAGIKGAGGESFSAVTKIFYTAADTNPVLPKLANDEDNDADNTNDLLSVVQHQTFKYFWDFAHPVSGMARERNTSGDIVTSGGTGFGIMALVVGIERNFITRTEGIARMDKMVTFLESADRFHGAWSHWINGSTGDVVPFSTKDNGGDLVETSFLIQGLLTFRQYLNNSDPIEEALRDRITALWEGVEWDWYRKNNEDVLYWHWSPSYNWEMNFPLSGYFEEQVTYFLAASSPTHGIPKLAYTNGYGKNGAIVKNNTYYGYTLPLESPSPLFWVQYSYMGLDPHFSDDFANYWDQNVNATRINQAYCIANPKKYVGYSENCWGLTSSDEQGGYDSHSPSNDKGVITPTAALSSFPYTPTGSMKALKFFYYSLGDRLWGEYGFYDAFNLTESWTADSYLAIDQGPIIVMIENYRTGLLWDLFMSAPEVQVGKTTLGLTN